MMKPIYTSVVAVLIFSAIFFQLDKSQSTSSLTHQNTKDQSLAMIEQLLPTATDYLRGCSETQVSNKNISSDIGLTSLCFHPDTPEKYMNDVYEATNANNHSLGSQNGQRHSIVNRWSTTATDGGGLGQGDPTTITWSYVPDGTPIGNACLGETTDISDFVSFFNGIYGNPTDPADLTTAPWHQKFVDMFTDWSEKTGLTFIYEPNDDGVSYANNDGSNPGVLGVRGDIRIGGDEVDGNNGILACNYFPNVGDMIIDTEDNWYSNNSGLGVDNVLAHEIGHGLGLGHVCPTSQTKLMEPFVSVAFDGPQEDDYLAVNRTYGDINENNDLSGTAHSLGAIADMGSVSQECLSIDDESEVDFYSFSVTSSGNLTFTIEPTGIEYLEGDQNADGTCTAGVLFDAILVRDLDIDLLDTNGTSVLSSGSGNGAGTMETNTFLLPTAGTYFLSVQEEVVTTIDDAQMYDISASFVAVMMDCDPLPDTPAVDDIEVCDGGDTEIVVPTSGGGTTTGPIYTADFTATSYTSTTDPDYLLETSDYYGVTDGTNISESFTGATGDFYAAQDTDGGNDTDDMICLQFDGISIAGCTALMFTIDVAEGDDGGNQDWDANTEMIVEVEFDGSGTYTQVFGVQSSGGTNTEPAVDTNFDGVGDGAAITDIFTTYTSPITGTGTTLNIKITLNNLDAGDEDIAFDNVGISGTCPTPAIGDYNFYTVDPATDDTAVPVSTGGNTYDPMTTVGTSPETIYVTCVDENGCESLADAVVITVNALPTCTATSDSPVCTGDEVVLDETGGDAVSWSWTGPTGASFDDGTLQGPTVSPAIAGDYTVVITDANGCMSTCMTTVVINTLPTCTASNDGPVCDGEDIILDETGGDATGWSWTGPAGASFDDATLQGPTVSPGVAGDYTVVITDVNGCTSMCVTTLVINDLPEAPVVEDIEVCDGGDTEITVTSSGGGPASDLPYIADFTTVSYTSTTDVDYLTETTDYYGVTDGTNIDSDTNGTPGSGAGEVTGASGDFYAAQDTDGGNDTDDMICLQFDGISIAGCTALMFSIDVAEGDDGGNQDWDDNTELIVEVEFDGSGTYTQVFGVQAMGGTNSEPAVDTNFDGVGDGTAITNIFTTFTSPITGTGTTLNVKVTLNNLDAGDEDIAFDNVSVTGTCAAPPPGSYNFYTVDPATDDTAVPVSTGGSTYDPMTTVGTSPETIYVTCVDANGCESLADAVVITVNALPTCTATNDGQVCDGDAVTLNETGGDAVSWSWTGPTGASFDDATLQGPTIDPAVAGDYTVIITDANGCMSTCMTTLVINALPTCSASNNGPVCDGDDIVLDESGGDATSWSWTGPAGASFDDATLQGPTVSPGVAGDYTVVITDTNGCTSMCMTTVVINDLPDAPVVEDVEVCDGESTEIEVTTTGGGTLEETLFIETFEGAPILDTSVPEFTDGFNDFFTVTDGTNIGGAYSVSGFNGTQYFAGQDLDGEGATLPITLSFTGINISGYSSLMFKGLFAEDDDGGNQDWDDIDFVHIDYQIDGGPITPLLWIESDVASGFNGEPAVDTNFDGVGDAPLITSTFQQLAAAIAGTGGTLDIIITWDLDSGDEDLAIDDISICGIPSATVYNYYDVDPSTDDTALPLSTGPTYDPMTTVATSPETYWVTCLDSNGCESLPTEVTVTVNPNPTLDLSVNEPCDGEDLIFMDAGTLGDTWLWSGPNGFTSTDQNPVISPATVSDSGTYTVTVTSADGCTSTASIVVIVNPLPLPPVLEDIEVCDGESTEIVPNAVTDPVDIFIETFEGSPDLDTSVPEFTDGFNDFFTVTDGTNIGGAYMVSGFNGTQYFAGQDIDGEGATLPVTLSFTGININGFTSLEFKGLFAEDDDGGNEDWDLTDFVHIDYQIDGGGFQPLLWFESIPDGDAFNAVPALDTNFDGDGDAPIITDVFQLISAAIPTTGMSLDIVITWDLDSGDEDFAIDDISICGIPPAVMYKYYDVDPSITLGAVPVFGPTTGSYDPMLSIADSPTTIWVTSCSIDGCESTPSPVTITINPLPICSAENDGPVCPGEPVTLNETGGEAISWSWTGPNGFMSTAQNPTVDPAVEGVYTVVILDANGCESTCTTEVEFFDVPVAAEITAPGLCVGETIEIIGNFTGGTPPATYVWTDLGTGSSTGYVLSGTTTQVLTVDGTLATPGTIDIQYQVTDRNGCMSEPVFATLFINPNPVFNLQPTNAFVCPGEDAEFTINVEVEEVDFLTPPISPISLDVEINDGSGWILVTTTPAVNATDIDIVVPGALITNCTQFRVIATADHTPDPDCIAISEEVIIFVNEGMTLACNDNINLSVGSECSLELFTGMFLEGEPTDMCGVNSLDFFEAFYEVTVQSAGTDIDLSDVSGHLNEELTYMVSDICSGAVCWGNLLIEDKQGPADFECEDVTINCIEYANDELPTLPTVFGPEETMNSMGFPAGGLDLLAGETIMFDLSSMIPAGAEVTDVDVIIDLTDIAGIGDTDDIDLVITSPDGTTGTFFEGLAFWAGTCFNINTTMDFILDDEAPVWGSCADLTSGGNFSMDPAEGFDMLSIFDGGAASGMWMVTMVNVFTSDAYLINNIELIITYESPILDLNELDNCGNVDFTYEDVVIPGGDCGETLIERTYFATDAQGNSNSCSSVITVEPISLADDLGTILLLPPTTVILPCGADTEPWDIANYYDNWIDIDGDGVLDIPGADTDDCIDDSDCPNDIYENEEGIVMGFPHYVAWGCNSSCNDKTDEHFQPIDNNVCSIYAIYSDQVIDACGEGCAGNEKVIRTWTLIDWCSQEQATHVQVIKSVDLDAPEITAPDATMSVNPWGCVASGELPAPEHLFDACSKDVTYTVAGPAGTQIISVNGDGLAPYGIVGAPKGEHLIVYTAIDCCGNTALATMTLTVVDDTPPTAISLENIVVSLTSGSSDEGGTAKVYPENIDNGSHDGDCGPVGLEIRRPEGAPTCDNVGVNGYNNNGTFNNNGDPEDNSSDTDGGEYVKFCCDDIMDGETYETPDGQLVTYMDSMVVILRVWDDGNCDGIVGNDGDNYNEVWAYVRVENKLPPVIVCPPDAEIGCNMDWSLHLDGPAVATEQELAMLSAPDFGTGVATGAGVCGAVSITYEDRYNEDLCFDRNGEIRREWCIEGTSICCTQDIDIVKVGSFDPNTISWNSGFPEAEIFLGCLGEDPMQEPSWLEAPCDLIAWTVATDTFYIEGNAADFGCIKVINDYTVVDWCADTEYTFTQVIKVIDDSAPTLDVPQLCVGVVDGCDAGVQLCAVAEDMGDCESPWLKWEVLVDLYGDWSYDHTFSSYVSPLDPNFGTGPNEYYVAATAPGQEMCITLPIAVPSSKYLHRAVWKVSDGCGNFTSVTETFEVVDKKAPTPYCYSVSSAPMENGSVELWACDFVISAEDNCSEVFAYTFNGPDEGFVTPESTPGWIDATGCEGQVFTCPEEGNIISVKVYTWDECYNVNICYVELTLSGCGTEGGGASRIGGSIATEFGKTVENTTVEVFSDQGEYPMSVMTDNTGTYASGDHKNAWDYSIKPSNNLDHRNGVSTLDILLIQRHILNLQSLTSPYQYIAADANDDGAITAADLVDIRKLVLEIYDEFPNNESWRFIDATQALTTANAFAFSEVIDIIALSTDMDNEDFIASKTGDVNNSVVLSATGNNAEARSGNLNMNFNGETTSEGVSVEVTSSNFRAIAGYQFTLNTNGLEFASVEAGAIDMTDDNVAVLDNSTVTMSWNTMTPVTATDEVLFTLHFVGSDVTKVGEMEITSEATLAEAYDADLSVLNVVLGENAEGEFALEQNEPNPFSTQTTIEFSLPTAGTATLTVMDVTGKLVKQITGTYAKGANTLILTKEELAASGVLYYQLESGEYLETKKMIIVE